MMINFTFKNAKKNQSPTSFSFAIFYILWYNEYVILLRSVFNEYF